MAKVSVIIVAHNVEKYISDCIESVVNQTLEDIEIIVLDDCSADGTKSIIESYAEKDSRIKPVYNWENKGTFVTRNSGVYHAGGEYIMFVDGDDCLVPQACRTAFERITTAGTDVVQFGFDTFAENPGYDEICKSVKEYGNTYLPQINNAEGTGIIHPQYTGGRIIHTLWNKIYKKSVLIEVCNNCPDEYIIMAEDRLFTIIALCKIQSYSHIPDELYLYRVGTGLSTRKEMPAHKLKSIAKTYFVYNYIRSWLNENTDISITGYVVDYLKNSVINNICERITVRQNRENRQLFTDELLKYCTEEEFITILSYMLYNGRIKEEVLADICCDLKLFRPEIKEPKTIGTFWPDMKNGGVPNVVASFADIWVKKGYDVILFTDEEHDENDYNINPAVKRIVLPSSENLDMDSLGTRIEMWRRCIKEFGIDIIVYHAYTNPKMLMDIMSVKSAGSGFIMHTHGIFCVNEFNSNIFDRYSGLIRHKVFRLTDLVLTLSRVDEAYWKCFGLKTCNITDMSEISVDIRREKHISDIILIAEETEENYIRNIIKAVENIPGIKLTVLGSENDKYMQSLKKYINSNNLQNIVYTADFRKNILPLYKWTEIFAAAAKPAREPASVHKRTPLETAVVMSGQIRMKGMLERTGDEMFTDTRVTYYMKQCNALNETINEIRNSTSYRIGELITSIPRKIKGMMTR